MTKEEFIIGVKTLGCKVSQYESSAIAERLRERGFTVKGDLAGCRVAVINTCTVTAEADRKCLQTIRRAARAGAAVIVTGCLSELSPEKIREIPGVAYVCGTGGKMTCVEAAEALFAGTVPHFPALTADRYEPMEIRSFPRTRAYIKIEDGCDSHCSYCIIPRARGPVRSRPSDDVLREVSRIVAGGCREIVLTGIEVDAWGRDFGKRLIDLLEELEGLEGDFRIRTGSLDPSLLTPDFVGRLARLTKIAPHFHLSLQSGSTAVLNRMKRKYSADMALRGIAMLREAFPGVRFTADMIVGFPGETDEEFAETCRFVEQVGFLFLHIFPYSARPGTPAAEYPGQIPQEEKHRRAAALAAVRDRVRERELRELAEKKPVCPVLIEQKKGGLYHGHSAEFAEFAVKAASLPRGCEVPVRITGIENGVCIGVPTEEYREK